MKQPLSSDFHRKRFLCRSDFNTHTHSPCFLLPGQKVDHARANVAHHRSGAGIITASPHHPWAVPSAEPRFSGMEPANTQLPSS